MVSHLVDSSACVKAALLAASTDFSKVDRTENWLVELMAAQSEYDLVEN